MAIALRRAGFDDFLLFERADDLGGTWRDNTYPGCACDIPSILYSWSDAQNPRWTRAFSGQREIWDYMRDVVQRQNIAERIRFNHDVTGAKWNEDEQVWEIETSQGSLTAEVLISAAGGLADPSIPALPGLERFEGTMFHSARWNHEHDLRGRNVAAIGTGASAIQFVPEIQPHVAKLRLFQRTPPWVLPRANPRIPKRWQRRFERYPWLQRTLRRVVFSFLEAFHVAFTHPRLMSLTERRARRHIAAQVSDPALRERLTPNYRLGCKRILGSNDWYPAISQPNVEVVTSGIAEVTPDGIVDAEGVEHKVDTIIFGTGFLVTDQPIAHRVVGRGGKTLDQVWQGSPKAHLGVAVSGFPNFFMLLGPNTGLGHNSVLLMIEAQVNYLMQALSHRRAQGLAAIEPSSRAQAGFITEVEEGTKGSVWTAGGCLSWYVDHTGRNSALWPGTVRAYQRRLKRFVPQEYEVQVPRPAPTPARAPIAA